MSEQARMILAAIQDLRAGRISVDDARVVMEQVRESVGEHRYQMAKWSALAADVRRP